MSTNESSSVDEAIAIANPALRIPELRETPPSEIVLFRRSMGLPDSFEEYEYERRLGLEAHLRELVDAYFEGRPRQHLGAVTEREKHLRSRRMKCQGYLRSFSVKEHLSRLTALGKAQARGIQNPNEYLKVFEEIGSRIVWNFNIQVAPIQFILEGEYNAEGVHLAGYKHFSELDHRHPIFSLRPQQLRIGLERLHLLGYDADKDVGLFDQWSMFALMLQRLSQMPEHDFQSVCQQLNQYGCVRLSDRSMVEYLPVEATIRPTWEATRLFSSVEKGTLDPSLEARLGSAEELSQELGGRFVLPAELLPDFDKGELEGLKEFVHHATGEMTIEEFRNFMWLLHNDRAITNIQSLAKNHLFPEIAKLLHAGVSLRQILGVSTGWPSLPDELSRLLLTDHPGAIVDREMVGSFSKVIASADFPYMQALEEIFDRMGGKISVWRDEAYYDALHRKTAAVRWLWRKTQGLSDEERESLLDRVGLGYQSLFGEEGAAVDDAFQNDRERPTLDRAIFSTFLVTTNGEIDFQLVAQTKDKSVFPPFVLEQFINSIPHARERLAQFQVESHSDQWREVIPNPEEFWNQHRWVFAQLAVMEILPQSLRSFRRLAASEALQEIFRSKELSLESFQTARTALSINEQNITYLSVPALVASVKYLSDARRIKFYRGILAQSPRSFNSAVVCLEQAPHINLERKDVQQRIKQAIQELGTVTPMVLTNYVNEGDPARRKSFVERVITTRSVLFRNHPVKPLFQDEPNRDAVLAEFIALSFKGNDLDEVKRTLPAIDDRVDDLRGLVVREDGYEPESSRTIKTVRIKENAILNWELIDALQSGIKESEGCTHLIISRQQASAFLRLARSGETLSAQEALEDLGSFAQFFGALRIPSLQEVSIDRTRPETTVRFLGQLSEAFGVLFKDNAISDLTAMFVGNPKLMAEFSRSISAGMLRGVERNLSEASGELRSAFRKVQEELGEQQRVHGHYDPVILARLTVNLLEASLVGGKTGIRKLLKDEMAKFVFEEGQAEEVDSGRLPFKGFISKNAASYFAKRTAGLCTADDQQLFNRPDHFHVNLVSADEVVGNIQGYIIQYQRRRALLFRGFNPSASFVDRTNADVICDGMLSIVRKFAQDNQVGDVFVSEQLEGWHALTNRASEGVLDYFKKRYLIKDNEVEFSYPITDQKKISRMYRVPFE